MQDAYIYDAARTAFGRHGGTLSSVRPDDMLAHLIKTLVQRNNFDLSLYEDVIAGNTNQAGEDSRNVARTAGLLAGLSIETGGLTVNRFSGYKPLDWIFMVWSRGFFTQSATGYLPQVPRFNIKVFLAMWACEQWHL